MINSEEMIKQREIGQQIMMIRIIHCEQDRVSKGGYSFLDRTKLAKWAQKSEEEIERFFNDIVALDEFSICSDAALEYASELSSVAFGFFLSTFRKQGNHYIASMLGMNDASDSYSDGIEVLAKINARRIIDRGINVDEEIQSAARFKDALKFYYEFYISRIADVVSEGYDWDVVSEMLNEDKEFTELIKPIVYNKLSIVENAVPKKDLDDITQECKKDDKRKSCENCYYYELTQMVPYCTKIFQKRKLEFGTERGCKRWREKPKVL